MSVTSSSREFRAELIASWQLRIIIVVKNWNRYLDFWQIQWIHFSTETVLAIIKTSSFDLRWA